MLRHLIVTGEHLELLLDKYGTKSWNRVLFLIIIGNYYTSGSVIVGTV